MNAANRVQVPAALLNMEEGLHAVRTVMVLNEDAHAGDWEKGATWWAA